MVRPAAAGCVAIALLSGPVRPAGQEAPPPAKRLITENLEFRTAFLPCHAPDIAVRLAKMTGVPAGAEALPGPCGYEGGRGAPLESPVNLLGRPLEEAMDTLIALDPRYRWLETDGVIVIRPLEAWNNQQHFLHRPLASFAVDDQHIGGALARLGAARDGRLSRPPLDVEMRTEQVNLRFSVNLGATTIYAAMNAVVRAHGASWWQVRYCQPQVRPEFSQLYLFTFDGSGLGVSGVAERADGTRYNPCPKATR
jgi:hypothetical protein